jgi:hypothetical protein
MSEQQESLSGSDAPTCSRCGQSACRQCAICGEMECDHHHFEPVSRPSRCRCNALEWKDPTNIPTICAEHQGDKAANCTRCEHDFECHANH